MPIAGREAKLYIDPDGADETAWDEVTLARDVTLNAENVEAEVRDRSSAYSRALVGLHDVSIEFSITYDQDDAEYEALRDAWEAGDDIGVAVCDGDIDTPGTQGFKADCKILNFSRNEGLEDSVTIDVTMKISGTSVFAPDFFTVPTP
jgi:hypothetical protein